MDRPRLVLADRDLRVLAAVERVLSRDFEIVGVVSDVDSLVHASRSSDPHVIVVDFNLIGANGITAAGMILEVNPRARVVLTTTVPSASTLEWAQRVGVLGYVAKGQHPIELRRAIEAAARGERYVSWPV